MSTIAQSKNYKQVTRFRVNSQFIIEKYEANTQHVEI